MTMVVLFAGAGADLGVTSVVDEPASSDTEALALSVEWVDPTVSTVPVGSVVRPLPLPEMPEDEGVGWASSLGASSSLLLVVASP